MEVFMKEKICQSCAMPIETQELFGTNADGTKQDDYCIYCYEKGKFIQPHISMNEMISICTNYMKQEGMSEEEAKTIISETLPNIKRWKH